MSTLREKLKAEDSFVRGLVDKIPPKFYFDSETCDKIASSKHAAVDSKLKQKGTTKKISVKRKHKVARLDPQLNKTVTEIQETMEIDGDDDDDDDEQEDGENVPKKARTTKTDGSKKPPDYTELRERLKKKIQDLQAARGVSTQDPKGKKAMKKKIRLLRKKEREAMTKQARLNQAKGTANMDSTAAEKKKKKKEAVQGTTKPVFNKERKILYSKFDFADVGVSEKPKGEYSGKKYKKLLTKVEKEKQKLEEIEAKDPSGAKRLKEKKLWKAALERAEGIKVKDNPELLKKAMKRKEQQKKRSSKKWEARVEHTQEMMKKRQEKRKANIQAKKKAKKEKILKRAKKKGRLIPGKT